MKSRGIFIIVLLLSMALILSNPANAASAGLYSDDFYPETVLNPWWTFEDPDGTSSYTLTGTHAEISVAAGTPHEFYGSLVNAPRLVQPAANEDFDVVVKFDSVPTLQYQEQGIVVMEDSNTMLRLDAYSTGSTVRSYPSFIDDGSTTNFGNPNLGTAPQYLRVTRVGDHWTYQSSADAASWSTIAEFDQVMTVTAIGFFAGNAGASPAYTVSVDYFWEMDDVTPICIPVSDDFYPETTANSNWRFEDPDGTSSLTMTGTNAEINVAAGSHQFYASQHNAPRLVQNAPDTDFSVEVKFDSIPSEQYQEQGIVVMEDSDTMLRVETFHNGSNAYLYVAFIDGSVATTYHNVVAPGGIPAYLRLTRAGNDWTYEISYDGSVWTIADTFTQAMTVADVGFYGGNHTPGPAFTASADYFINTTCAVPDEANRAPEVTNPGNQYNAESDVVALSIAASDPDSDPITFSAINLPTGLSIMTNTGDIYGTVSPGASGTYNTEVTVTDGDLNTTVAFTWTIGVGACTPFSDDFFPETTPNVGWAFIDPGADGNLTMSGTNAEIGVPGGSAHEFWPGATFAPHLVQTISDDDFSVEAKFDTLPTLQYQEQGIVVKEDADTVIRFDTYSTGSGVNAFVVYIDGGSSDTKLSQAVDPSTRFFRVERAGDDWTFSTSVDGSTWTAHPSFNQPMTVSAVGVYGGNAGPSPAYTASVDYFNNLACPITDTDTPTPTPPVIDLWYGDTQTFGAKGDPQQWINVLGNISDDNGVSSLTYSLNSGTAVSVPLGPNGTRLIDAGDFNIEIDQADLIDGVNTVELTATDYLGAVAAKTLTLTYNAGNVWPFPYTADWSTGITTAGQVVDGLWEQTADGAHTLQTGYDRLIAIGDETWAANYIVTVPITVHSASNSSGIGFAVGWQGHDGAADPRTGWPLEAIGWIRYFPTSPQLQILTYNNVETFQALPALSTETTYLLKLRSEDIGGGNSRVYVKLWEESAAEPAAWNISADVPSRDGSVLLITHHADVTFGNVVVQAMDSTAPGITSFTRQTPSGSPTNADSLTFRAAFSEDVTNVDATDFSVSGTTATITAFNQVSADVYDITVSGGDLATLNGSVGLDLAGGQDILDLAGNALPAGEPATDETYTVDNTAPSLSSFTRYGAASNPTNQDTLYFQASFDEDVANVSADDFTVNSTSTATVTAVLQLTASTYRLTVSGGDLANFNGDVGVNLAGGQNITDLAGNALPAGEPATDQTWTVDNTVPTVTIDQTSTQDDPTGTSPINFTVEFSESVTGFTGAGVSLGGSAGATTATVTGSGTSYNVAVSGMSTTGTVIASISAGAAQDSAGNASQASTSTDNVVTYDISGPTLSSFARQTPSSSPTNADILIFRATFSEDVTNVDAADFDVTGTTATITDITEVGAPVPDTFVIEPRVTAPGAAVYDITVSGGDLADLNAIVGLNLASGQDIKDVHGNDLSADEPATDETYEVDNTAPTVSINQASTQDDPTNGTTINFTVEFSESVNNFNETDITLGGSAGATTATVTGSGTSYNVAVSGMTSDGTVTASIPANAAQDDAANDSEASTSTDNEVTFDTTAPTVTINQAGTQVDPTGTSPINFTVEFSEAVVDFTDSDVTLGGTAGATTATVTGSGASYNVAVSGMTSDGTITASIAANTAQDSAGNDSEASTSTDNEVTYNTEVPLVVFGAETIPANNAVLTTGLNTIIIEFSIPVKSGAVPGSAEDTANYLLVEAGSNEIFDTVSCAAGAALDDTEITIDSTVYDGSDPYIVTLGINGGALLPKGSYRLYICGTTSIESLSGVELNNGLSDTLLNFTIQPVNQAASTLPDTGFTPGEVTILPAQPTEKAYDQSEMVLEIPRLNVSMNIVGVPVVDDAWDVTWLGDNAGYLYGSAYPTWAGNTVLTGHVFDANNQPGPFINIKNLQYGDRIMIYANGQTYIYEVRETTTVFPSRTSTVFQHEEYDWITLVTCEVFNPLTDSYVFRRVVRAILISVE